MFEHPSREDGRAAGWVTALMDKGTDGLHAKVEWNQLGLDAVRSGEYRYLSPEFGFKHFSKEKGEVIPQPRLGAVALTNRPFLERQDSIAATDVGPLERKDEMDPKLIEDLSASVAKIAESVNAQTERFDSLTAKIESIELSNKDSIDKLTATKKAEIIANAIKEGRIAPAQKENVEKFASTTDAEGVLAFVNTFAPQSRSDTQTVQTAAIDQARQSYNDSDLKFFNSLGMTPDEADKYSQIENYDPVGQKALLKGSKFAVPIKALAN